MFRIRSLTKRQKCYAGAGVLFLFFLLIIIVPTDEGSTREARPTPTPGPTPTPTVYEDTDEYKGFHCLSAWDGNHEGLEGEVRDLLNDPGSMKTYKTTITPNRNGTHVIRMEFGATNAYGAMVRHTATGEVDNVTCEATLVNVN